MQRTLASAALLPVLLSCTPASERAERPRLVVMVVVDQLRADYIERFRDHYVGGLGWLLDRGAYFPEAEYRHSGTVTAAGHATVATGLHPSSHGIVGNSWRETGRGSVYCVGDDDFETVGGEGEGRSPAALLQSTLGDHLKRSTSGSRVYTFSTKDRSAILMAGGEGDGAFWFNPSCGCFVSSSYYGENLPGWLAEFNASGPADAYAGGVWDRLWEDESLYVELAREDRHPTEHDGNDTVFPHALPVEDHTSNLAATPFSDELTLAAATAALRAGVLGADADPDILGLGLSATDSVGHRYGPFSQEAMDNHLRLDRALQRFLDVLDETVGLEHVAFGLTADHGAIPLVEHLVDQGVAAQRFRSAGLWENATSTLERCGGGPSDEIVDAAAGASLFWDVEALRERGTDMAEANACVATWLAEQEGVEAALTAEQLATGGSSPIERLFANSYREGRSAHVQLHLKEYYYSGGTFGTGHGSAHAYDRHVPVLLAGYGIRAGSHDVTAGPEDVAPTLGVLLGLELPTEPDTRVLHEALQ